MAGVARFRLRTLVIAVAIAALVGFLFVLALQKSYWLAFRVLLLFSIIPWLLIKRDGLARKTPE
jgi:ABC-type branched-subunit amino acid transport system permease subunit